MEPKQIDFSTLGDGLTDSMKEQMQQTYEALQQKWQREKQDPVTVYSIEIPAQSLTVYGQAHAKDVLMTLKGCGVTGAYRMSKEGFGE